MMQAFRHYPDDEAEIICGIPTVTLAGDALSKELVGGFFADGGTGALQPIIGWGVRDGPRRRHDVIHHASVSAMGRRLWCGVADS